MRKKKRLVISACCLVIVGIWLAMFHEAPGNGGNSGNPNAQIYEDRALSVIKSLAAGNYDNAARDFGPDFMERYDLKNWIPYVADYGRLKECTVTHAEDEYELRNEVYCVYVRCEFEKGTLYEVARFDTQKKISRFGLYRRPQR